MKIAFINSASATLAAISLTALLAGCGLKPVDEIQTVGPSETAFLVALDGDTKTNQAKLVSMAFLEANKVSAKRIVIPHKLIDTCPSCFGSGHKVDVPTAVLYRINHAPVTREWSAPAAASALASKAFAVESVESIDFKIGGSITAHVKEDDGAKYLFFYSGKQLENVIDTNVRSFISTILSREFGSRTYDAARKDKNVIFATAQKETREFFTNRGITIDNFGFTEGMTPNDNRIQEAINKKFEADIAVGIAEQQMMAAKKIAEASGAVQIKQDLEIRMKLADLAITMANKWDGHGIMPQYIVAGDRINVNVPVDIGAKK